MQHILVPPDPLHPLPSRSDCYVPVLQHRKGECTALENASPEAWTQTVPLIEEVPWGGEMSYGAVKARVRKLAKVMASRPFYLDTKRLDPLTPTDTGDSDRPVLELFFEETRKRALPAMPVAWSHSSAEHFALVADIVGADGHGLALRHRFGSVISSEQGSAQPIETALSDLGTDPQETDLLLDLEFIDWDRRPAVAWLRKLLSAACKLGEWRSLVLIGTSVPASFSKAILESGETREFPRQEWSAWRKIEAGLDRGLAYGDYAVQNPIPPLNPPPIGPFATIRYTTSDRLLVARGWDVQKTGPEQYTDLSQKIVAHRGFRGEDYSYGDKQIAEWSEAPAPDLALFDAALEGDEEVGGLESGSGYWRGVGTSHHIEEVTEQLRALAQSA